VQQGREVAGPVAATMAGPSKLLWTEHVVCDAMAASAEGAKLCIGCRCGRALAVCWGLWGCSLSVHQGLRGLWGMVCEVWPCSGSGAGAHVLIAHHLPTVAVQGHLVTFSFPAATHNTALVR
jgi:hypothetical protein